MNPNTINQYTKGTDIFKEKDPVFYVAMIIKGRVLIHNDGARIIMGSGAFLGINDLFTGRFQSTYTALDDLILYIYQVNHLDDLDNILTSNKDYHGFMVASYYKMIYELDQIHQGIIKLGGELYQFIKETYASYQSIANRRGYNLKLSERINQLLPLESEIELIRDRINYYNECKNLPIDVVKAFFSYGNAITQYQLEDQVSIVEVLMETLKKLSKDFIKMGQCLMDESEECLFHLIATMMIEMRDATGNGHDSMNIMDDIIEQINKAEILMERTMDRRLKVNRKKMEEIYHLLLTGDIAKDVSTEAILKYSREDSALAVEELNNSFQTLLGYGGIEGEIAQSMLGTMEDYIHLRDKTSSEDTARAIRRKLAENHYQLYKAVFIRAYREKKAPRIVELFLRYGYADERLLTKEQLLSLYFLPEAEASDGPCKVYDIKTWLTLIYEGKKEPSKNEFDLEYPEMLASLKKQGKLTDKEVKAWMDNSEKKLEYEIQNMFRYNNRTTNGQITTFVPVLHKDQWSNDIERLYLTASKVNEAVASIMRIDYSVFDREVIYVNKEKNIVKEYIMKRVYPDIILMPNVGANGIMWQEISGKRRDSAGRLLLPIFTDANLKNILIKIFGRFRWELCRTIEGAAWNDITHKSLTSEYSDYLQFYRKNKELSEEKKEKIKLQIQKGRNNSRETFVIDYEQWINYEANGAVKLNKPVREMLSTYCPFSKEIREQIKLQPLFEESMARYYREKQRKVREMEGRLRLLQKEQIEVTQELLDTLSYYRDL